MSYRVRQLDAIRGIAILMVMLHNQLPRYPILGLGHSFASGWMGVDLFFVLSGLLITGILVDTRNSTDYFKNFYARRCLRIWPLYFSVLILMFVIVPIVRPSEAHVIFADRSSPWWAYPLFLQNFLVPSPTSATGPLGVTWSLAIEEQFYLVWPLAVRYFTKSNLWRIGIVVVCLSPLVRWYLARQGVDPYTNLFCRLDGLMLGSLLALQIRAGNFESSRFVRPAWILLLIALPLALLADAHGSKSIVFSLAALSSVALVYLSLFSTQRWLQAVMTNRFLVYTGAISYGLYLLHKIPFDIAQILGWNERPLLALPLGLLACYGLAALSWNLLEKPFLKLKRFFDPEVVDADRATQPVVLTAG